MLKLVNTKKVTIVNTQFHEAFQKEYDEAKQRNRELLAYIEQLEDKIQDMHHQISALSKQVEEEKDKYKKYVKQMRQKNNETAKKWLNGYPDE